MWSVREGHWDVGIQNEIPPNRITQSINLNSNQSRTNKSYLHWKRFEFNMAENFCWKICEPYEKLREYFRKLSDGAF